MAQEKFLYGASVQGIQNYIFQTNELQDIIGASEMVKEVCTTLFKDCVGGTYKEDNVIMTAAGNVKYIFESRETCERVVREFPKKVAEAAPGVTFSQAVEMWDDNPGKFKEIVDKLEKKLRIQRNRPMKSTTIGRMGILRSRKTGLPVAEIDKGEYLDETTLKKREAAKGDTKDSLCEDAFGSRGWAFPYDVSEICDKNNWIAIIHADGNGLGKIVQDIGHDKEKFRAFSQSLDKATKTAAQAAFRDIFPVEGWGKVVPIRPIVIGGDDFTVICRGTLAMDYAKAYLFHFEKETEKMLKEIGIDKLSKLTACAGIAFIKSNYPFYYGYELAEALCGEAKKDAKSEERLQNGIAPSCLMFHKVQDSFVTSFAEIEKRELTPADDWSYKYGPYYLYEQACRMTIDKLVSYPAKLKDKEGNALKSGLRKWMTCLAVDGEGAAEQMRKRIEQITSKKDILNELLKGKKVPVYDILSLCSIMYQETNNKGNKIEEACRQQ